MCTTEQKMEEQRGGIEKGGRCSKRGYLQRDFINSQLNPYSAQREGKMYESLKVRLRRRRRREGKEAQRKEELESAGRGSVGVRAHTDRCLRSESLLGSEHH